MSEAVVSKKSDGMANLIIILFVICLATSLLLGLVNMITAPNIKRMNEEKTQAAKQKVLMADEYTEVLYTGGDSVVKAVFQAGDTGYVVQVAPSGFGGNLNMMVGVGADGTVTGVDIISHAETSGLGANATKPAFKDQYRGQTGPLAVKKDGGTIDALTGATITSRAVTSGVNAALEAVASLG